MCCSLPSKLLSLSCSRRTISTYQACGKLRVVLFPISLEGREKKVKITDYQLDSELCWSCCVVHSEKDADDADDE